MAFLSTPSAADPQGPTLPQGQVLGTYSSYGQARGVLDALAAQEFDVTEISIVGTDLRLVERVRGRLTYPKVALRSAVQGALFGGVLGLLMLLVDPSQPVVQVLTTAAIGAGVWVIMGVIGLSLRRGRGGFESVQQLVPSSFDVVCPWDKAAQAQQLMRQGAGAVPAPTPGRQSPAAAPEQHGSTGAGSTPAPAAGAETSASETPVAPPAASPEDTAGTARQDWSYPDLPDGTPQFGVRLPEAEAQRLRERMLAEQGLSTPGAAGAGPAGGPQSFARPDYSSAPGESEHPAPHVEPGAPEPPDAPESPDSADSEPDRR